MNKSERKNILRELEDKKQKDKALTTSRYLYEDIHWRDVGLKLMQIFYKPSFEPNKIWDIRWQENKYVLFESQISNEDRYIIEPGYTELDIETDALKEIIYKFNKIKIPIGIPESNLVGLDGTGYEVILFGLQKSIGIEWWEDPHEDWQELSYLTKSTINTFLELKKRENET